MKLQVMAMGNTLTKDSALRHTAWAIWGASLSFFVVSLSIQVLGAVTSQEAPPGGPDVAQTALLFCLQVVTATTGLLIVAHVARNPVGWILATLGLLFGLSSAASSYASFASASLPGASIAAWGATVASGPIVFSAFTFLFLLFPTGRLMSSRWRWTAWIAATTLVLDVVSAATIPGPLENYPTIRNPFGIGPLAPVLQVTFSGGFLVVLLMLVISAVSVMLRFRRSQGEEREQLKWVASATIFAAILLLSGPIFWFALPPYLGQWWPAIFILAAAVIPIAICVAMLKYRLYDIDVILNRTLVYGVLTVSIVGLYILIAGGLGEILQARGSLFLSLVVLGVVALLIQPFRERLQRGVNQLMYGQRDEPYAVISQLGRRLEATLAPEAVFPVIVETVAEALKLPYVAIELKADDKFIRAASAGEPVDKSLMLPLLYQSETLGQLVLGRRSSEVDFSVADQTLLGDLARQASAAAYASHLMADLQRSRERLVTAREEERRRLRRDLHDGLGPELATMAMQSEAARDLLTSDPVQANALLSDLTEQLQAATADIRRLIHELRPPALDDLGLLGALRNQIIQFERSGVQIVLDAPNTLPALPAATEVAAYRITVEALNNVVRHAEARGCRVEIASDAASGHLRIAISDDGRGMPNGRQAGVGLASMRERAAELGGVCAIERAEAGGTRVHMLLPLGSTP